MDKDLTSLRQELALMKQGLTSSRVGLPVDTVNARVKTATEAYTPGSEMLVLCDATDDAFTVTLPAISGSHKRMYTIKKIDSEANAVTVDGNGTETIDGAETYTLSSQYEYVVVIGGTSEWHIVGGISSGWTWGHWSSTSWDGDAKSAASGTIDLSAVFGLPAGIKAISAQLQFKDGTADVRVQLKKDSAANTGLYQRTQVSNIYTAVCGIVDCDASGDVYFYQSGDLDNVYIFINGYLS